VINKHRPSLGVAKGLGAAGEGTGHWLHQRFSAMVLLVFVMWFVYFLHSITASSHSLSDSILLLQRPHNIIMMSVLVIAIFYHASLGLQVVIEDYVKCRLLKILFFVAIKIFVLVTVASMIVALLKVMVL
jgi:succinate dehydrogenase / fumarate reductase membrane anchor subunit